MASGSKARKKEEEGLKAQATAAAQKVAEVDPFEQRQRQYVADLDDWRMGRKGPINVRDMPGSGVGISLFNEAKQARDAGRIGRGLGVMSDGANPNFATALDKEMQLERDTNASGMLEGYVSDTMSDVDAKMMGLSGRADARNRHVADLANQRYNSYINRPQQPGFLKQLAMGALSNVSGSVGAFGI